MRTPSFCLSIYPTPIRTSEWVEALDLSSWPNRKREGCNNGGLGSLLWEVLSAKLVLASPPKKGWIKMIPLRDNGFRIVGNMRHNWRPFHMTISVNSNESLDFFSDDSSLLLVKSQKLEEKVQVAKKEAELGFWSSGSFFFSSCFVCVTSGQDEFYFFSAALKSTSADHPDHSSDPYH
ncbi:putative carboxylesterase 17 [Senna tora]|uniref:Putative carboxylesterase 17 n=1 Tax=Senna tora TaxID=362788 RepID=A0A834WES5_9FABA|nr:putative carboxylesterase 17 [Senna tora]